MKIAIYFPKKKEKQLIAIQTLQKLEFVKEIALLKTDIEGDFAENKKVEIYDNLDAVISNADILFVNAGADEVATEKDILKKYNCEADNGERIAHIFKALRKMENLKPLCDAISKSDKKALVFVMGCCAAETVGYITNMSGAKAYWVGGNGDSLIKGLDIKESNPNIEILGTEENLWITKAEKESGENLMPTIIKKIKGGNIKVSNKTRETLDSFSVLRGDICSCSYDSETVANIVKAVKGEKEYVGLIGMVNKENMIKNITNYAVIFLGAKILGKHTTFAGGELPLAARCLSLLEVGVQVMTVISAIENTQVEAFRALCLDSTINRQFSLDDIKKICNEVFAENNKSGFLKSIASEDK